MSTGLLPIVKRAALDAVHNSQLCDLRLGIIVNVSPLKVQITPQLIIPKSMLTVPQHLTNHELELTLENSETPSKVKVHNALKIGDRVALLRQQGGQSYFILDRI